MKRNKIRRTLALLSGLLLLSGEALPVLAAGGALYEDEPTVIELAADEADSVTAEEVFEEENSFDDGAPEESTEGSEEPMSEAEISDNEAFGNTVSENVSWKEPSEKWYEDFSYSTKDGKLYLKKAKESLEGNVVIPATATISGKEYKVVLQPPKDSFNDSIWNRESEKLSGLKFEKGVGIKGDSCSNLFAWMKHLKVLDVSALDLTGVTDLSYMFRECPELEVLNISGWDTSNVTKMGYLFYGCSALKSVDLSSFDTSKVTSLGGMFCGCENLTRLDLRNFNTSKSENFGSMFENCKKLETLDISSFDTSLSTSFGAMFMGCESLTQVDVSKFVTSKAEGFSSMFEGCKKLEKLDLSSFDTSSMTNITYMFKDCRTLEELDLSHFNTSKVTLFWGLFMNCSSVKKLDLRSFDSSGVTDMQNMFNGCTALTELNVSSFETLRLRNMYHMFNGCASLQALDLSNFKTDKVTDMSCLFSGCKALEELDISSFRTPKVKMMDWMFNECESLKSLDLRRFDTARVETMASMFDGCKSLTDLDLRSFVIMDGCSTGSGYSFPMLGYLSLNLYLPVHWAKDYSICNNVKKIYYAGSKEQWEALNNTVPAGIELVFDYTEGMLEPEVQSVQSPLDPQPVITAETAELYLIKGQKFMLYEEGWTSSDPKALYINKNGKVTAKKVSSTVTLTKGGQSISVNISQPKFKRKTRSGRFWDNMGLGYADPFGFTYDDKHLEVLWHSSNPDVATVNEEGTVFFIGKGKSTITAYINGKAYKFTVKSRPFSKKAITRYARTLHMNLGDTKPVAGSGGKKAEWLAYGNAAKIEKKYKVTGLAAGRATVETNYKDTYVSFTVYVEDPTIKTEGIKPLAKKNQYSAELTAGERMRLEYAYVDQQLVYKSSKPDVAIVDEYGNLITRSAGKTKLTTKINGKKISITVTVTEAKP